MDPRKRKYEDETPQRFNTSTTAEYPVKGPNYLKFLLPEKVAGTIIGKGGSAITELEIKSGASIKLAPSGSCYPRTSERSVSVGGSMDAIEDVVLAVTNAIKDSSSTNPPFLLRVIIPSPCVSGIIGRDGEVVKTICHQTGATIRISKDEKETERIADVSGNERSIFRACMLVATKIQEFPFLYEYSSVLYPNATKQTQPTAQSAPAPQQQAYNQPASPMPLPAPMEVFNYTCTIQFMVPTPSVPSVEILADIFQQTGARVSVSDSPGNDLDKTLTITGPMAGVQAAHILLIRRVGDFLQRQETEQRYVQAR